MFVALQILRLLAILALLAVAGALATPKDRLPIALRGLTKLLARDGQATGPQSAPAVRPSLGKRLIAAVLVFFAVLLAVL